MWGRKQKRIEALEDQLQRCRLLLRLKDIAYGENPYLNQRNRSPFDFDASQLKQMTSQQLRDYNRLSMYGYKPFGYFDE